MGKYFVIANMDRKEYIHPHHFKTGPCEDGFSMKLDHICSGRIAGVLPFLLSTSSYYDFMGSWAKDRIVVVGDEGEEYHLYEEVRDGWKDISAEVATSYFEFVGAGGKSDYEV